MKIAVLGGDTGVAARLSNILRGAGHRAHCVAGESGQRINEALADAGAIVDFAHASAWPHARPCCAAVEAAARLARNAHYVAVSDVGAECLASSYFSTQRLRERKIAASPLAHTVVRMTLSFESVECLVQRASHGGAARLPATLMQPVGADDAASMLARIVLGRPQYGVLELAGPEAIELEELARELASAREIPLRIIVDPKTFYFGAPLERRSLLPGAGALLGADTFAEWLRRSIPPG
jgi:uncharacterized protein YbjT (DUF2867 family)